MLTLLPAAGPQNAPPHVMGGSRRTLEKRFRATLGRGIHEEIIRRRIDEARRLLRETTLTIAAIAEDTGFANAQRFYTAFQKLHGATPGTYRRSYRG